MWPTDAGGRVSTQPPPPPPHLRRRTSPPELATPSTSQHSTIQLNNKNAQPLASFYLDGSPGPSSKAPEIPSLPATVMMRRPVAPPLPTPQTLLMPSYSYGDVASTASAPLHVSSSSADHPSEPLYWAPGTRESATVVTSEKEPWEQLQVQQVTATPHRTSSTSLLERLGIGGDPTGSGKSESELPLPLNWAVEVTADGIRYYVDHTHRRTHWIHPLTVEPLPAGWKKVYEPAHGVLYYNERTDRSQLEHPGLAADLASTSGVVQNVVVVKPEQRPEAVASSSSTNSTSFSTSLPGATSADSAPRWLKTYYRAPAQFDHLLKWNMFSTPALSAADDQLLRLYRKHVFETIAKYERMRVALKAELEARGRGADLSHHNSLR